MPESLATTKRKFYRFLDQLSGPSTPAQHPSSSNNNNNIQQPLHSRPLSTAIDGRATASPSLLNTSSFPSATGPANPTASSSSGGGGDGSNDDPTPHHPDPHLAPAPRTECSSSHLRPTSSSSSLRSTTTSYSGGGMADRYRARLHPLDVGRAGTRRIISVRAVGGGFTLVAAKAPRRDRRPRRDDEEDGEEQVQMQELAVKRPYFTPWSHEDFLERLKTFGSVMRWMPKPEGVGDVQWAMRGWTCVGIETVGCEGCGKRMVVDFGGTAEGEERSKRRRVDVEVDEQTCGLEEKYGDGNENEDDDEEPDWEFTIEMGLVEKYAPLIAEGHGKSCPWRKTGCKKDVYRLPVVRSEWWQEHVKTSIKSVLEIRSDIEKLRLKLADGEPTAEKILQDLPGTFFGDPKEQSDSHQTERTQVTADLVAATAKDKDIRLRALTIALTGWHATTTSNTNLLTCHACFQRIGLWMYLFEPMNKSTIVSDAVDDNGLVIEHELVPRGVDLLELHRDHCPWRNAATQAATGTYDSQPAWRILWDVVARYADEQRRRSGSAGTPRLSIPAEMEVEGQGNVPETSASAAAAAAADGEGEGAERTLSRQEVYEKDKERTKKLRRLKSVLGIKFKIPGAGKDKDKGSEGEQTNGQA